MGTTTLALILLALLAPALAVAAWALARAADARRRLAETVAFVRRQEEQLEHSARLAEIGGMTAEISHELNQPLTGIRTYARNAYYMIEKRLGNEEEVKTNLRLISEQVDRASKIIGQMRELTRRSDQAEAEVDLAGVVRESIDFLLPQMRLARIEVVVDLAPDLPRVRGDRTRLAQVFLNLLTNARQAMEASAVRRLAVRARHEAGRPHPVVVEVADTGIGFSAEDAGRLFQPFYTTKASGHGLGLSISRGIVSDHGGTIEAAGSPGEGATFTVRLPAAASGG